MDTQQLKLLAANLRALLEQENHPIGHSQSLDLIAAIPGLRNWPEVQAFPDRVASAELDLSAVGRLAYRLERKFQLDLAPLDLLQRLAPPGAGMANHVPQIWPSGPQAGIYVTTSPEAIDALLALYEDATDGALIYAERAGSHWASAISLGDHGLWSNGLDRVPSGTLIVIGPVELNQQMWQDSGERLEMACYRALNSGHRVVVLVDTPTPDAVYEDIDLLIRLKQQPGDDLETALIGTVSENGELVTRRPFANPWPVPKATNAARAEMEIPGRARELLRTKLRNTKAGLLIFGSTVLEDHPGADLVADSLELTTHIGPAARVMPRNRSTPAKDWLVPSPIKELPFLPSIQSAYAQGYRRIIVSPGYSRSELLVDYAKDALIICGVYGENIERALFSVTNTIRSERDHDMMSRLVAVHSVKKISQGTRDFFVNDLYIHDTSKFESEWQQSTDVDGYIRKFRALLWEEEIEAMLRDKMVTLKSLRNSLARDFDFKNYIPELTKRMEAAQSTY